MAAAVRLAELLGLLSFAGDLGRGQPMGHVLRTCRIAMAISERLGLSTDQQHDVYFTALLLHAGCTAGAPEFAAFLASDELQAQKDFCLCDPSNMKDLLGWLWSHVGDGRGPAARGLRMLKLMAQGEKAFQEVDEGCSDVGSRIASRLGMSEETQRSLYQVCEVWSGKGPHKLRGEAIPLPARLINAAMITEVFFSEGGVEAARAAARARSGKSFDPAMAEAIEELCGDSSFWNSLQEDDPWDVVLDLEPEPVARVEESSLDEVCLVFADIVDLKSTAVAAHSRRTAELSERLARRLRLDRSHVDLVRRAGLVHDVGLVGVPAYILNKERLGEVEFEKYRLHPYFTERVLSRSELTRAIGEVASSHHERLNGRGYHKGLGAAQLPTPSRILSLACAFEEQVERTLNPEDALLALRTSGHFDVNCLDALAAELGEVPTRQPKRNHWPAELTDREVEVLRLIAAGNTVRQSAQQLVVSEHTARHHLESIYSKIGVSSRAGAVLFAAEHNLLG